MPVTRHRAILVLGTARNQRRFRLAVGRLFRHRTPEFWLNLQRRYHLKVSNESSCRHRKERASRCKMMDSLNQDPREAFVSSQRVLRTFLTLVIVIGIASAAVDGGNA